MALSDLRQPRDGPRSRPVDARLDGQRRSMPASWNIMWSSARSEAARTTAGLPVPVDVRSRCAARRRLRLRYDERARLLKLTCPLRTSRRAALAWAAEQRPGSKRSLPPSCRPSRSCPGPSFPLEGPRCQLRLGRRRSPARRGLTATMLRCGGPREGLRAARSSVPSSAWRSTSCRAKRRRSPRVPVSASGRVSVGDADTRWGSCSAAGADPLQLAADPRAARSAPLRRRARGRALVHLEPRRRVQGAGAQSLFGGDVAAAARSLLRRLGPRLKRVGRGR